MRASITIIKNSITSAAQERGSLLCRKMQNAEKYCFHEKIEKQPYRQFRDLTFVTLLNIKLINVA